MQPNRDAFRLILAGILATLTLALAAQSSNRQEPEALKRADAAFRAGYAAQQAGNLELARAHFAEAARFAPRIPEAHEALGTVLIQLGKPAEAVQELEAALKLKPGDQGIETNLALAQVKANESAKAIAHFSAAFKTSQQAGQQPVDAVF
jgi:Flp pilus assembly protein TadD